jgi:hypothetical protein
MALSQELESLVKAIHAGNFNVAPDQLRQGAAIQLEDCSPQYVNTTFEDKHILLQKEMSVKKAKSTWVQWVRRLSYGRFGGSAQLEGAVGRENTSDLARIGTPMCYYSEIRRTTLASNMVESIIGEKPEDIESEASDLKLAGDIEFDVFRGKDDFSNAGVFDGNPLAIPALPNMLGVQAQIRQADTQANAQDLMFLAYGGGLSSVINQGGTLSQEKIEDASVRSAMNHGSAETLAVDPLVQSAYNKIMLASNQRVIYPGGPVEMTGTDLRRQSTYNGMIQLKASRFLSGKFQSSAPVSGSPAAPSASSGQTSSTTSFLNAEVYNYYFTAENEIGESPRSAAVAVTISASGNFVTLTITPGAGTSRFFNVYRSAAGGSAASARFIGRVANSGAATTAFIDRNNRIPGFVTGVLYQGDTMDMAELAPYTKMKLAVTDLSTPEAHFRFCTVRVYDPKKNVIIDNLRGSL